MEKVKQRVFQLSDSSLTYQQQEMLILSWDDFGLAELGQHSLGRKVGIWVNLSSPESHLVQLRGCSVSIVYIITQGIIDKWPFLPCLRGVPSNTFTICYV